MSYTCINTECPNSQAQMPKVAAASLNFKCFLCQSELAEPKVTLDQMLEKVDILPVSLQILPQLQRLLQDDDASLDSIASTARVDASLVTKLITMANSAHYSMGQRGACNSVEQALTRVGLNKAYSVVSFIVSKQVFMSDQPLYNKTGEEMWKHSARSAYCMERLAPEIKVSSDRYENPEASLAFTLGLVNSVGQTVISQYYKSNGCAPLDDVPRPLNTSTEQEILGFTNIDVTMTLLAKWHFSQEIISALNYMEKPLNCNTDKPLACLLSMVTTAVEAIQSKLHDGEFITMPEFNELCPLDESLFTITGISKSLLMETTLKSIDQFRVGSRQL
jgi:HD-like signal output (HDOD) protein